MLMLMLFDKEKPKVGCFSEVTLLSNVLLFYLSVCIESFLVLRNDRV